MRDTNLVNALREHADWWENGDMMDPLGGLEKDLLAAADRIANQSTHIAALQKEIEKLRAQLPRWIPVEEHLPENGVPVLINYIASDDGKYHPDGTAVWTDYGCFWWEGSLEDCDTEVAVPITHWMPLPEPPEEVRRRWRMNNLKYCPFCGGINLKIDSKRTFQYGGKKHCSVSIQCMKCHARGPVIGINMPNGKYNEREICENAVTEAWNRRADNGN